MIARREKRGRQERTRGMVVEVGERDLDVLAFIGLVRHATTEQVARDLFPNADRARRRVRALFDGRLLSITVVGSTRPNVLSLTAAGRAVLADHRPYLARRLRAPGPLVLAGLDHHLAIVDMRLFASALGARRGTPLIAWANACGDLARDLGFERFDLRPDGVAEFATEGASTCIAVEVDKGTESLPVLGKKVDLYAAVAADGQVDALWLVIMGGNARQRNVEALVARAGLEAWARVFSHAEIVARPAALPARGGP